jgi:hypothetical protein
VINPLWSYETFNGVRFDHFEAPVLAYLQDLYEFTRYKKMMTIFVSFCFRKG